MDDKTIFKLGIIGELLEGKEPLQSDFVAQDGLTQQEYFELIEEMQNQGLIKGVHFAESAKEKLVVFFNTSFVTEYGKSFFNCKIETL